jgi:hypothetical protein
MTQRGSCKNRRFGGTYLLDHQGDENRRARNNVSSNYQLKSSALRTDVSEKPFASNIRVIRIGELGTTLVVTSNRCTIKSRRFGGTYRLHHQDDKNRRVTNDFSID